MNPEKNTTQQEIDSAGIHMETPEKNTMETPEKNTMLWAKNAEELKKVKQIFLELEEKK